MSQDQNEDSNEDQVEEVAPAENSGGETAVEDNAVEESGVEEGAAEEETTEDEPAETSGAPEAPDANGKGTLKATPLWALHKERRGKMVPFSGYEMPVQYRRGIMAEHKQTRERAGLFDVSHMGQAFLVLEGEGGHEEIAGLIETLVPGEIKGLKPGGIRYTLLLNDEGGIKDDLMITRPEGEANEGMLFLVVNAATKDADFEYISEKLEGKAKLIRAGDRALMALQGPRAVFVMKKLAPFVEDMGFMTAKSCRIEGIDCIVSRCGYTGEDGFEFSVQAELAEVFARKLLANRDVSLIGLGARDSLRLEAGLCLYGHDIDETTTPIEAGLAWAIGKRRKIDKDFPGATRIMEQLLEGAPRRRVGILPKGKAPAREGTEIVDKDGKVIGKITSGGFGPSVRGPIAMGYIDGSVAEDVTEIGLMVRGQSRDAEIVPLPFIEQNYVRPGDKPKAKPKTKTKAKAKTKRPARKRTRKPKKEEVSETAEVQEAGETEVTAPKAEAENVVSEAPVKDSASSEKTGDSNE
jgi:aminomethyltransferase